MKELTIFLDIDGVLNLPHQFGKRINKENVEVFNKLINELEKSFSVQIVISSSWRLSSGINKTLREAGAIGKMKGVTENYGDRNKEINEYITKNKLDPNFCIALDDEKDIVEKVVCKYFITNFSVGITEKDISKIISLFTKKKRFF